jgi:hypothetical protein
MKKPNINSAFNDFGYLLNKYCSDDIDVAPRIETHTPNVVPAAALGAAAGSDSIRATASEVPRAE